MSVAALYVDPRGPYPKIPGVDCWDESRHAELYDGPHPVVAHPPCGSWSTMCHLSNETTAELGLRAFEQVRRWGGILEQPEHSRLFLAAGAPRYFLPGDVISADFDELPRFSAGRAFTVRCEQVSWGHVARKATWLYMVGIDPVIVLRTMRTGGTPTHWCSGSRGSGSSRKGAPVPPGIKVCSAQQRRRTPPAFAEWLVSLALEAKP